LAKPKKTLRVIPALNTPGPNSPARATPHAPPAGKVQGRPLPDLNLVQIAPRGPAHLHLGQRRTTSTGGPGVPPLTWIGPATEWVWHWCSRKYFYPIEGIPPEVEPWGGLNWQYQVPSTPGAVRSPGSEVTDFVYQVGGGNVLVRIEGFFDHVQRGGAAQVARDLYLVTQAGGPGDRVVRVNDAEFMEDESGSTGIKLLAEILGNRTRISALAGGLIRPPRYANFEAVV
jgi:hypothetical protein